MSDVAMFFGVMMTLVTTGLVGYAGVVAIRRMQRGANRHSLSPLSPDEFELLRMQVDGVEGLRARVAELEERVDFSERLLAQAEFVGKLPPADG